jgi:hypothetical protein
LIEPNDRMRAEVIQIEEIPRAATANMYEPLLEMCEHIVDAVGLADPSPSC